MEWLGSLVRVGFDLLGNFLETAQDIAADADGGGAPGDGTIGPGGDIATGNPERSDNG